MYVFVKLRFAWRWFLLLHIFLRLFISKSCVSVFVSVCMCVFFVRLSERERLFELVIKSVYVAVCACVCLSVCVCMCVSVCAC